MAKSFVTSNESEFKEFVDVDLRRSTGWWRNFPTAGVSFSSRPSIFMWISLRENRRELFAIDWYYSCLEVPSKNLSPTKIRLWSVRGWKKMACIVYSGEFCKGGRAKRRSKRSMEQRTRVNSCFVRFVFLTRVNVRCQETSMSVLVSRDSIRRFHLTSVCFELFRSSLFVKLSHPAACNIEVSYQRGNSRTVNKPSCNACNALVSISVVRSAGTVGTQQQTRGFEQPNVWEQRLEIVQTRHELPSKDRVIPRGGRESTVKRRNYSHYEYYCSIEFYRGEI